MFPKLHLFCKLCLIAAGSVAIRDLDASMAVCLHFGVLVLSQNGHRVEARRRFRQTPNSRLNLLEDTFWFNLKE